MLFVKNLKNQDHTRRYSITPSESGWEVREERDREVVRRALYHDWHRVERVKRSIVSELDALREAGWRDAD